MPVTGIPAQASATTARHFLARSQKPRYPADRDSNTQGHPAREELEADCGGHPPAGDTPLLGNRAGAAIATGWADYPMAVSRLAGNDPAWEILARVREALLRL